MNWFHTSMSDKNLFLYQGLSQPFYGYLVYKFKKFMGRTDFSDQLRIIIILLHHKRIGYSSMLCDSLHA